MTLFCYFTHGHEQATSCYFGLNDKIAALTYSSTEHKVTATQEFVYPDAKSSNCSLICMALSPDHLHLVAAYSNKAVVAWELLTGALMGQAVVHKKPTALVCSSMPENIRKQQGEGALNFALVSDKGGEVWAYALPSLSRVCKVLGHTSSVITDLAMTPDGRHIVTADRDEKIRLTSFPETSTISGYCLGHTDVVTSMALLSTFSTGGDETRSPLMVSSGWDHRLCLWDTEKCRQLDVIALASSMSSPVGEQDAKKEEGEQKQSEEEDETATDKVYDETKAGNFPLRVIAPPPRGEVSSIAGRSEGVFAVLFWHKPEIHIRHVERVQQDEGGQARFKRGVGAEKGEDYSVISLPAAPIDCMFVDDSGSGGETQQLLVLLPAPHYLVTCSLPNTLAATISWTPANQAKKEDKWAMIAQHFSEIAIHNGLDLKQRLVFTDDSLQEMKKHALDKPYAHAPKKKKGKKNE